MDSARRRVVDWELGKMDEHKALSISSANFLVTPDNFYPPNVAIVCYRWLKV